MMVKELKFIEHWSLEGCVNNAPFVLAGDSDEASLERALAMSVEGQDEGQLLSPQQKSPDFAHMTEEEQIAFAMQMSLQENRKLVFIKDIKIRRATCE